MAKRFTDTELYDKEWFQLLSPEIKCLWEFIRCKCDCAGIWKPNKRLAEFSIGSKIDWETALKKLSEQIEVIQEGRWWIKEFCRFQYGTLSENCKPHIPVIFTLNRYGLYDRVVKGLAKGMDNQQDKEKEKDISSSNPLNKETLKTLKTKYLDYIYLTKDEYDKMVKKFGEPQTKQMIDNANNYAHKIGIKKFNKRYDSHYHVMLSWDRRDKSDGTNKNKLRHGLAADDDEIQKYSR